MKPAEDPALYLWSPSPLFSVAETFPGPVFAEAPTMPVTPSVPLPDPTRVPSIDLDALRGP